MLSISEKTKQIYKTDRYPYRTEPIDKEFCIKVVDTGTIIDVGNMEVESFKLNESICSDTDIRFGACESSAISFTIYDFNEDLKSKWIEVYQIVDGERVDFGTYRVATISKLNNPMWKEVVAYDRMVDTDVDVVDWFNAFWSTRTTSTILEMRTSLLDYLGFTYIDQPLINDDMPITKTIEPEQILARYVLQKIAEVNATFGHFNRQDKFKFITLLSDGLYPSETLYPAHDLYPAESGECIIDGKAVYFADESKYADYIVQPIDGIQFNGREGNSNTVVSDTGEYYNPYIIEENFLLYDKTEEQLKTYGNRILNTVKDRYYVPADISIVGLPYLEVGDSLYMEVGGDMITTFVFERELKGMVSLSDQIIAKGNEWRNNFQDIKTQMLILKEQSESYTDDRFEQAVDEVEGLSAQLEVVKGSITGIVSGQAPMWDTGSYEISYSGNGQASTDVDDFIDVKTNDYYLDWSNGRIYKAVVTGNEVAWTYVATGTSYMGEISGELALKIDKDDDGRIVSLISGSAYNISFNANNMFTVSAPNLTIDSLGNVTATNFHALKKLYLKNSLVGNEVQLYVDDGGTRPSLITTAYEMEIGRGSVATTDDISTAMIGVAYKSDLSSYAKTSSLSNYIKVKDDKNWGGSYGLLTWNGSSTTSNSYAGISSNNNLLPYSSSSRRYKHDIDVLKDYDATKLYDLPVRQYVYNDGYLEKGDDWENKAVVGFIAEEVEELFPIATSYNADGSVENWKERAIIPLMLKLIQDQKKEIDELKSLLKEKGVIE